MTTANDTPQDVFEELAYAVVYFGQHKEDCAMLAEPVCPCTCGYANAVDLALRHTNGKASPTAKWAVGAMGTMPSVNQEPPEISDEEDQADPSGSEAVSGDQAGI